MRSRLQGQHYVHANAVQHRAHALNMLIQQRVHVISLCHESAVGLETNPSLDMIENYVQALEPESNAQAGFALPER